MNGDHSSLFTLVKMKAYLLWMEITVHCLLQSKWRPIWYEWRSQFIVYSSQNEGLSGMNGDHCSLFTPVKMKAYLLWMEITVHCLLQSKWRPIWYEWRSQFIVYSSQNEGLSAMKGDHSSLFTPVKMKAYLLSTEITVHCLLQWNWRPIC